MDGFRVHLVAEMFTNRSSPIELRSSCRVRPGSAGFSLIETLIAVVVLTFGLLAAGQLVYIAMGSTSLARSKGNATVVAQNKLDSLADLYRQNPGHTEFTNGSHGPEQVQITNPASNGALNRYNVEWTVSTVPDPRPGKILNARRVYVQVTPIGAGTSVNNQASLNKVLNVTTIFSARTE